MTCFEKNQQFMERRNIAVNIDDEWIVISGHALPVEDVIKIGRLLGVIEEK